MLKDATISGHLATFWPLLKIFLASKNALKKAKKRLKQAKKAQNTPYLCDFVDLLAIWPLFFLNYYK